MKKSALRRILAIALSAAMVFGNFATAVEAVGIFPDGPYTVPAEPVGEIWEESAAPESPLPPPMPIDEPQLPGETLGADLYSNVVHVSLDQSGKADLRTGETGYVKVLAFNDNPNEVGVPEIKIRINAPANPRYEGSSDAEKYLVYPVTREPFDITGDITGGLIDPENHPAKITGMWASDSSGEYLSFMLPAGTSVSFDIPLTTVCGYEKNIDASVSYEWSRPGTAFSGSSDTDAAAAGMPPSAPPYTARLNWTAGIEWDGFEKSLGSDASGKQFYYKKGTNFAPDSVSYDFTAVNKTPEDFGYIYTSKLNLTDVLTLPAGISVPADAVFATEPDGDFTYYRLKSGEKTVYELKAKNGGWSLENVGIVPSGNTITLSADVINSDPENSGAGWNPFTAGNFSTRIYLNNLTISDDLDASKISFENGATFTVREVSSDGKTDETTYVYEGTGSAEISMKSDAPISINKAVAGIYEDKDGAPGDAVNIRPQNYRGTAPIAVENNFIKYTLTVTNSGLIDSDDVTVTDEYSKDMVYQSGALAPTAKLTNPENETSDYTGLTVESAENKLEFTLKSVPAGSKITITYWLKLKPMTEWTSSKSGDYYIFNNTASLGKETSAAEVAAPGVGEVTFKKIVMRRTLALGGQYYRSSAGRDGKWGTDDDVIQGSSGCDYGQNLKPEDAILQMEAGDAIEYVLILDNQSSKAYKASRIQDYAPFSKAYGGAAGWKYMVKGESQGREMTYSDSGLSFSKGSFSSTTINNPFVRVSEIEPSQDFFDHSESHDYQSSAPEYYWNNLVIPAMTTYYQSVTLIVPGDPSKPTEDSSNRAFQELLALYRSRNSSRLYPTANADIYFDGSYSKGYPMLNNAERSYCATDDIIHSVAPQLYLSTGVLATVEAPSGIAGAGLYTEDGSFDSNDLKKFYPSDNQYVVNYVYIFNDSAKQLDLSRYTVGFKIPYGFEWQGFTTVSGGRFSAPQAEVSIGDFLNTSHVIDDSFHSRSSFGIGAYTSYNPSGSAYTALSDTSRNDRILYGAYGNSPDQYLNSGKRITVSAPSANANSTDIILQFSGSSSSYGIEPYSGFYIYYVTKVNTKKCGSRYASKSSRASFGAGISYSGGYTPLLSTAVSARNTAMPSRVTLNDGVAMRRGMNFGSRTNLNGYYICTGTTSAPDMASCKYYGASSVSGTASDSTEWTGPYSGQGAPIYSYVSLYCQQERIMPSLEKKVDDNYGSKNPMNREERDGYHWGYPLHDGIHRTVDGTVEWEMKVSNDGTNKASSDIKYGDFSYSTIVDVIDHPYKLLSLSFTEIPYKVTGPDGTEEYKVYTIPGGKTVRYANGEETLLCTIEGAEIYIRFSEAPAKGIAYGPDADDQATRYLIELSEGTSSSGGRITLELPPREETGDSLIHEFKFRATFETDESILTNYNSFGLAFPGVDPGLIDSANLRNSADNAHESNQSMGISAVILGESLLAPASSGRYALDGYSLENVPLAEYSDWTDTSYTDGQKTMTFYNSEGEVQEEINTREDGDMQISSDVAPGSKAHTKLAVENILFESESYDYIDKIRVYDLFGVIDNPLVDEFGSRSGYIVDFGTIKVYDNSARDITRPYVFGTDYDIYYTFDDAVAVEHHPITPVNTLHYAADMNAKAAEDESGNVDDPRWIKYDGAANNGTRLAADGVTVEYARGIMIELKGEAGIFRQNEISSDSHEYSVFVEFDSTVAAGEDHGADSVPYPNVLAYTGEVHVRNSGVKKPFFEDTTAILMTETKLEGFKLQKNVSMAGKNYNAVFSNLNESFEFLIYRSSSSSFRYNSNIEAVALAKVLPGSYADLSSMELIYSTPGVSDMSDFFKSGKYYCVVELGRYSNLGDYKLSFSVVGSTDPSDINITKSTSSTSMAAFVPTKAEYAERFSEIFGSGSSKSFYGYASFRLSSDDFVISFVADNVISSTDIELHKVSSVRSGDDYTEINSTVKFRLYPGAGSTLDRSSPILFKYNPSKSSYEAVSEPEEGAVSEISFKGHVKITGLEPGRYTLEEIAPPAGYKVTDGGIKEIAVTASPSDSPQEIIVINDEDNTTLRGSITLKKVKAGSKGELITESNAKFSVYPESAVEVIPGEPEEYALRPDAKPLTFEKTVGEDGAVYAMTETGGVTELETSGGVLTINNLKVDVDAGSAVYYVIETVAPRGYDLDPEIKKFEISRLESDVEAEVENTVISATLIIEKVGEDLEKITDGKASFKVYKASDVGSDGLAAEGAEPVRFKKDSAGVYTYQPSGTEETIETVNGEITLKNLPGEDFVIFEESAPAGYAKIKDGVKAEILSSTPDSLKIINKTEAVKLRTVKTWRGAGTTEYPMENVSFALFEQTKGEEDIKLIETGVSDKFGSIEFESDICWTTKNYYLYEKVDGYTLTAPSGTVGQYYLKDDLSELKTSDPGEGYSLVDAVMLDISPETMALKDGVWEFEAKVVNVRQTSVDNVFNSASFKTISNHKIAQKYGIKASTGYSFYYTGDDYKNENSRNFVDALVPGDTVTYTLNVINMSEYPYKDLCFIDVMPDAGDTGVVNTSEERSSRFSVKNTTLPFKVYLEEVDPDTKVKEKIELAPEKFTVEFSKDTVFTDDDFDGVADKKWISETLSAKDWTEAKVLNDAYKSFRVTFADDVVLGPGCSVVIEYDGIISADAKPSTVEEVVSNRKEASIAWNNFAYRYTADTSSAPAAVRKIMTNQRTVTATPSGVTTIASPKARSVSGNTATPEPLKVGVIVHSVPAALKAEKSLAINEEAFTAAALTKAKQPLDVSFKLEYTGYSGTAGEKPAVQFGENVDDIVMIGGDGITLNSTVTPGDNAKDLIGNKKLWFTQIGTYTFKISEILPGNPNPNGTYTINGVDYKFDETEYTVTVDVEADDFTAYIDDSTEISDASYSPGEKASFSNAVTAKAGLTVTKTVTNPEQGGDETKAFDFELTLKDGEEAYTGDITLNGKTLSPKNEKYEFTLHSGETATFGDIPAGLSYTVSETEASSKGYEVKYTKESGTVVYGETPAVKVENTFKTGDLTLKKTVTTTDPGDGAKAKDKEFTFKVEIFNNGAPVTDKEYTHTVVGDGAKVEFKDGVYTVTLKNGQSATINDIPDGYTYSVTETEDPLYVTSSTGDSGTIAYQKTQSAEFTNAFKAGRFEVEKILHNPEQVPEGQEFNFELTLKKADGTAYTEDLSVKLAGSDATLQAENEVYKFSLKNGEKLESGFLPEGMTYSVKEVGADEYDVRQSHTAEQISDGEDYADAGSESKITDNVLKSEKFENIYKAGEITVAKTVSNPEQGGDLAREFEFKITLTDGEDRNVTADFEAELTKVENVFENGKWTEVKSETVTATASFADGVYTFKLNSGESLRIKNIPDGYSYTVSETPDAEYRTDFEDSSGIIDETVVDDEHTFETRNSGKVDYNINKSRDYVNTFNIGCLTVSKTVGGEQNPDYKTDLENKTFEFTIKLSDVSGKPVEAEYDYKYLDENGGETERGGKAKFTGGSFKIKLKHGEKIKLYNIPNGYSYTVEETPDERYITASEGALGKIETDKTSEADFTNTLNVGSLVISKTKTGGPEDIDYEFGVKLTSASGEDLSGSYNLTVTDREGNVTSSPDATVTNGSTVALKDMSSAKISGLPVGTKVTVTELESTAKNYYVTVNSSETETVEFAGSVVKDDTLTAAYHNDFDDGEFTLEKEIDADGFDKNIDPNQEFEFTVTLKLKGYELKVDETDGYAKVENGAITVKSYVAEDPEAENELVFRTKLKTGEKVTVDGIPNGTAYEIKETEVFGYTSDQKGSAVSADIKTDDKDSVKFVNHFDVGALSVSKRITGSVMEITDDFEFKLTITDRDGKALKNKTLRYSVGETVEEFTLDEQNSYSFKLKDGEKITFGNIPLGAKYTLSETLDEVHYTTYIVDGSKNKTEGGTITGQISAPDEELYADYTNDLNRGSVSVSKTLSGTGGENDKSAGKTYTFEIKAETDLGRKIVGSYPSYSGDDPDGEKFSVTFDENGTASVTLKHGERITITALPAEAVFTVTEKDSGEYDVTVNGEAEPDASAEGTVAKDETTAMDFDNYRVAKGDLTVAKHVSGRYQGLFRRFQFIVTLSDRTINGQYGDMFFNGGVAMFWLGNGESLTAAGLPEWVSYTVLETLDSDYNVTRYGETGVIRDYETSYCTYYNHFDPLGSLMLSKRVIGSNPDREKVFLFDIVFSYPDSESAMHGPYSYFGSKVGTLPSKGGIVALRHGESITITGIPVGAKYAVTEIYDDDYENVSGDADGYIVKSGSTFEYVNKPKDVFPDTPTEPGRQLSDEEF